MMPGLNRPCGKLCLVCTCNNGADYSDQVFKKITVPKPQPQKEVKTPDGLTWFEQSIAPEFVRESIDRFLLMARRGQYRPSDHWNVHYAVRHAMEAGLKSLAPNWGHLLTTGRIGVEFEQRPRPDSKALRVAMYVLPAGIEPSPDNHFVFPGPTQ